MRHGSAKSIRASRQTICTERPDIEPQPEIQHLYANLVSGRRPYRQPVDNAKALPTACPHSRASRPRTPQDPSPIALQEEKDLAHDLEPTPPVPQDRGPFTTDPNAAYCPVSPAVQAHVHIGLDSRNSKEAVFCTAKTPVAGGRDCLCLLSRRPKRPAWRCWISIGRSGFEFRNTPSAAQWRSTRATALPPAVRFSSSKYCDFERVRGGQPSPSDRYRNRQGATVEAKRYHAHA